MSPTARERAARQVASPPSLVGSPWKPSVQWKPKCSRAAQCRSRDHPAPGVDVVAVHAGTPLELRHDRDCLRSVPVRGQVDVRVQREGRVHEVLHVGDHGADVALVQRRAMRRRHAVHRAVQPLSPRVEPDDGVVCVPLRGGSGAVVGAEAVVDAAGRDAARQDLEPDQGVDRPVPAPAARVGAVLEGGQGELGGPDALRPQLLAVLLVVGEVRLGDRAALDVGPAGVDGVVAVDVPASARLLLEQGRRGGEFEPGSCRELDDVGRALDPVVREDRDRVHEGLFRRGSMTTAQRGCPRR